MAAVLRVKRRCNEEPLEALVLACKKRKQTEEDPKETVSRFAAVLKLTSTVQAQDSDLSVLLPVNEQEDIWKSQFCHKVDIAKKIREQRKQYSENSRFKVVNCFRHVDAEDAGEGDPEKKNIIVYDIESSKLKEDAVKSTPEDDASYVYDIYYGQTNNENDFTLLDHLVDIMPYSSMDFLTAGAASDNETVDDDEDDDDSNDENNWRNDYPDSDHSVNEDDMRLAMQMGEVNLGNELSSSDELIYEAEADPQDTEYYGEEYAKYKARVRKELKEIASSDNENSLDGNSNINSDDENEDPILRYM